MSGDLNRRLEQSALHLSSSSDYGISASRVKLTKAYLTSLKNSIVITTFNDPHFPINCSVSPSGSSADQAHRDTTRRTQQWSGVVPVSTLVSRRPVGSEVSRRPGRPFRPAFTVPINSELRWMTGHQSMLPRTARTVVRSANIGR